MEIKTIFLYYVSINVMQPTIIQSVSQFVTGENLYLRFCFWKYIETKQKYLKLNKYNIIIYL